MIYAIIHISGRKYIGETVNLKTHGISQLQEDFIEDGVNSLRIEIIEEINPNISDIYNIENESGLVLLQLI